jgi:hypothetical protein
MGTELDALAIGNCYLDKREQNSGLVRVPEFEAD